MGSQMLEQHWESALQAPAFAIQQAPLVNVWPVEQFPQLPPQPSSPHVLPVPVQLIGVQHVPLTHTWPEEHETQVPIEESRC
jgi:hypothetical protein